MKKITRRGIIKSVPAKYKSQYFNSDGWRTILKGPTQPTYDALIALDLETATEKDISDIIGNESWTRLECDECDKEVETVIMLGQEPDYESSTACICPNCLAKATNLTNT